ncbi:hypothetical protein FRX31_008381 [Thalictrum thalictroides]|uniref:Uncharacterized protein n=1 Tax=Thalictrum thalictroides TaxID=46969 RepID=A0A7J6X0V4_THATH|nr:hypothetical protein FRX31_008381 [Thalictrum thalictroides]
MCNAFYQVADLATGNEDRIKYVMQWITQLRDDLKKDEGACENSCLPSIPFNQPHTSSTGGNINPTVKESSIIRSPVAARHGGRPPFKRKAADGKSVVGMEFDQTQDCITLKVHI